MVGRGEELAALQRLALAAADRRPGIAVIEGEAGIGKSRLVEELVAELAPGSLVVRGNCSPVAGRDIALGPFVDALGDLLRSIGPEALEDAAGAGRTTLATLLPELGPAHVEPSFEPAGDQRDGYVAVAQALRRVAATRPVLLVIEDVHWADQSSLDLLTYLARTLREEQLAVVVTVRTPDPAYDDVRACVSDLARLPLATRMALARLDDAEAAAQVRNLDVMDAHDEGRVARIVELSEGVPLLVEELVDAPTLEAEEVAERVFGHRVASLPEAGRAVVEAAALGVAAASAADLAAVAPVDGTSFDEGLARAVSAGVVTRYGQTVEFRHALFRDAVLARLAPHVSRRLHAAWADVVRRQPASLTQAITLAHHLAEAGDAAGALDACLAAADIGDPLGAFPEVFRMLLKASELWPRVPDAESRTGRDLAALLAEAAEAAIVGEGRAAEGKELLRRARAALPPDAPRSRWAWLDLVWNWGSWNDGEPTLTDAELLAVVEAIPPEPQRLRWWACESAAEALLDAGRADEAETYVGELLEMAAGHDAMANALRFQARLESARGRHAEAVEIARDAVRRADRSGVFMWRARCRVTLWLRLYCVGELQEAAQVAEQAVTLFGGDRPGAVPLDWAENACNLAELLLDLGRWQDADRHATAVLEAGNVRESMQVWARGVRLLLSVRRGADFRMGVRPANGGRLAGRSYFMFDEQVEAELCRSTGDLEGARSALRPVLELEPPVWNAPMALRVMALAAAIEADGVRDAGTDASEEAHWVASRARYLLDALPSDMPMSAAFAETARAHLVTCEGEQSPEVWASVVERWRVLGMPFELGWALLRLGESAAREGHSCQARDAWDEALRIGNKVGALPLVAAAESAARRARVRLPTIPSRTPTSFGLTTRELEVLRLLAGGATNSAIAQQLFMSPKTASVHVSHVIAKLGVANRTEAAAIAHKSGLLGEPKPRGL